MIFLLRCVNRVTLALLAWSGFALGQGLTVSARPGLVNYFEGDVTLNGNPLFVGAAQPAFLNNGDELATQNGKAEVLLMPGTFLRIGSNSRIFVVSASLAAPRVELQRGQAMLEVVGLVRASHIEMVDHGALLLIEKDGLYRLVADETAPVVGVLAGSAQVTFLGQQLKLHRGSQTWLVGSLQSEPLELAEDDDLYAWSSVRSQYEAAASYDAASRLAESNDTAADGWYFNTVLDCWTWLPVGGFFSPFGWGFYSPVSVGSATVVKCSVYRGGRRGDRDRDGDRDGHRPWVGAGTMRPVPINPMRPPSAIQASGSGGRSGASGEHGPSGTWAPPTYTGAASSNVHGPNRGNSGSGGAIAGSTVTTASHVGTNSGGSNNGGHSGWNAGGGGSHPSTGGASGSGGHVGGGSGGGSSMASGSGGHSGGGGGGSAPSAGGGGSHAGGGGGAASSGSSSSSHK